MFKVKDKDTKMMTILICWTDEIYSHLIDYHKSYLKKNYFLPKVNSVAIFLILNLCPSDRKTVAFPSLQL